MRTIAAYGELAPQVGWVGLRVGGRWALFHG